jgi:hypothetical protein
MKVEGLVLKRLPNKYGLFFNLNATQINILRSIIQVGRDHYNDYYTVDITLPYKSRSTGLVSQSHHLNGHIAQIAQSTGNDFETIKNIIKIMAMDQYGYPSTEYKGERIPKSEADCNTVECGWLIDCAHQLAAEAGIILREK